jgi:hypothetical protein
MHFYSVVTCKNVACRVESAVRYLGIREEALRPAAMHDRFFPYKCPQCHKRYVYDVLETRAESYGFSPPPDFVNQY